MSDSIIQFPHRGNPAEFCLRNDIRPGDQISSQDKTLSYRITAIGERRVLAIENGQRESYLEPTSAMDSGFKGWKHIKGPAHEVKSDMIERHAIQALLDCDVAFAMFNICDLSSQARSALRDGWASVQDAMIRAKPNSGYARAVLESPDSAYNLVRSDRKIRDELPEQPANTAFLPEAPASTTRSRS